MGIEEDWGALEGSEWGSAPLAEAATVKPVPQVKKDTPQKTKAVKNKHKKLKVLDLGASQEKPVEKPAVIQPKKKKSKNKYKTDDGRVLGKLEFEEVKKKSKAAKSENQSEQKTEERTSANEGNEGN